MNEEKKIMDEALKDVVGGQSQGPGDYSGCPRDARIINSSGLTHLNNFQESCYRCSCKDIGSFRVFCSDTRKYADAQECYRCHVMWLVH